jgi:hypothetical protein
MYAIGYNLEKQAGELKVATGKVEESTQRITALETKVSALEFQLKQYLETSLSKQEGSSPKRSSWL